MSDTNLVCKLSADERDRRRPRVEALFGEVREREETDRGYAFRFDPDDETFERLSAFVDAERKCCPFFRFEITIEPNREAIWLEVGGDDTVQSFVEDQMLPTLEEVMPS